MAPGLMGPASQGSLSVRGGSVRLPPRHFLTSSGKGSGVVAFPKIPENFKGWGMGDYLLGWNWEGSNKPNLPACYSRQQPIPMKVRLSSSHAVPTARTFTLRVELTAANVRQMLVRSRQQIKQCVELRIMKEAEYG